MKMAISLIDAIRSGNVTLAKKILAQRKFTSINSQTPRQDGTALFWACCHGFFELAHLLLIHEADPNITTSWNGSPLHAACDNNHIDTVRLLIRFGANINEQTSSGDTPCHLAAYRGFAGLVQTLVESGANLSIVNNKCKTAVIEADSMGHTQIARYLLSVYNLGVHGSRNTVDEEKQLFSICGSQNVCRSVNAENNIIVDNVKSNYSQNIVSFNDLSLTTDSNVNKLSFRNIK